MATTTDQNDAGPSSKRHKPNSSGATEDGHNNNNKENNCDTAKSAWEHYRNFIDGACDEEDGGDSNEEDAAVGGGGDGGIDDDGMQMQEGGETDEEGGGDVDELLELIEILSSTEISPLSAVSPASGGDDGKNAALGDPTAFHSIQFLLPILLSMSYLHLASHAISETFVDPEQKRNDDKDEEEDEEEDKSSSSPDYYFQQSLHYWPTNPAANSLLANYHRMNSLSSTENICALYVKASECASQWRRVALEFLQSSPNEKEDEMNDINPKEWVELLVLNGALGVDYIGEDDEDDEDSRSDREKTQGNDEYSASEVEATASFMSAFLLSILSKHQDALPHLKKFQLSHRIHPNVWKAAQSHGSDTMINQSNNEKNKCNGKSTVEEPTTVHFPPRMYQGGSDGVLPTELYQRLCKLFAPGASYWKESDYDNRGYYSYFIGLDDVTKDSSPGVRKQPTNIIEEVIIKHLLPLAEQTLRESNKSSSQRIVGAEWWVHTRALGANLGHQVHFDTDESLLGKEKKVTHPIISSVMYLTGAGRDCQKSTAGSTIVFDQSPESTAVASQAWLSHPQDNAFMTFPGNLLHGVLPCTGDGSEVKKNNGESSDRKEIHRLTFMVGFWTRDVTEGMGERNLYTPCGPLPPPVPEHSWVLQSQMNYSDKDKGTCKNDKIEEPGGVKFNLLPSVSPAWEEFQTEANSETPMSGPTLMIPKSLDHRFFVQNAPRCFSDSLYEKEDCF